MTQFVNKEFLKHVEDLFGYPNMSFEVFYQQGLSCGQWRLPKTYIRQAYRELVRKEKPTMWQVRAFLHGVRKGREDGKVKVGRDYVWPVCTDPSWLTLICVYPDGNYELDFTHRVSRVFWSEENSFSELPVGLEWRTLEKLGFEIMHMYPICQVTPRVRKAPPTLRLVT